MSAKDSPEEVMRAFQLFDIDKSGKIRLSRKEAMRDQETGGGAR